MPDPNDLYYPYEPGDMPTGESLNDMQQKIKTDIQDQIAAIQTVPHAGSTDNATESDHAKQADNSLETDHAKQADNSLVADHAKQADNSLEADHAKQADNAATADSAKQADNSFEADHAKQADNSRTADNAKQADNAKTADFAKQADNARTADNAKQADNTRNADYAKQADNARTADSAKTADNAWNADHAKQADNAHTADNAKTADHARTADHAKRADHAKEADHAKQADNSLEADHAKQADNSLEADHAKQADNSLEADHAKQADNSAEADHAKQADNSLEADHAKQADNSLQADHAKQADNALTTDNAKQADNSFEADHAKQADNSDKLGGQTSDELTIIIIEKAVKQAIEQTIAALKGYGYLRVFKKLHLGDDKKIAHGLGAMPLVDAYQLDYFEVPVKDDVDDDGFTWVNFYVYHSDERRFRKRVNNTIVPVDIEPPNTPLFKISLGEMLNQLGVDPAKIKDETSVADVLTEMWKKLNADPHDQFDRDQYASSPWFNKCCKDKTTVKEMIDSGAWDDLWVQFRPRKTINLPISTEATALLAAPVNIEVKQYDLNTIGLKLLAKPLYPQALTDALKAEGRVIEDELKVMVLLKV